MIKFSPGFPNITKTIQNNEAFKGHLLVPRVPTSDGQDSASVVTAATEQDHGSVSFHSMANYRAKVSTEVRVSKGRASMNGFHTMFKYKFIEL